jgi:hypothetical protein
MLAKLTSKNQLTLPKSIIRAIGQSKYFEIVENRQIILTPYVFFFASIFRLNEGLILFFLISENLVALRLSFYQQPI